MQGSFDKSGETDSQSSRSWSATLYALPALLAMALIAMAMTYPAASVWISQAAQAEFADTDLVPDVAPTQLAKPSTDIRIVRAS